MHIGSSHEEYDASRRFNFFAKTSQIATKGLVNDEIYQ